jgi:hypothetical protein
MLTELTLSSLVVFLYLGKMQSDIREDFAKDVWRIVACLFLTMDFTEFWRILVDDIGKEAVLSEFQV